MPCPTPDFPEPLTVLRLGTQNAPSISPLTCLHLHPSYFCPSYLRESVLQFLGSHLLSPLGLYSFNNPFRLLYLKLLPLSWVLHSPKHIHISPIFEAKCPGTLVEMTTNDNIQGSKEGRREISEIKKTGCRKVHFFELRVLARKSQWERNLRNKGSARTGCPFHIIY